MGPSWRQVEGNEGFSVDGFIGQVIAVEQGGELRPFVSLVDLERWAATDPSKIQEVLRIHQTVYDGWQDKTGGVYVNKSTL